MSWQLGAFALLGLALAAGLAWYERSRPDSRVVALVASLAAFAALGRIAFAALPNVKPTTDIVLIAGVALGAGPGFAVGALAGLTSNFFFGQGPWTPWQMAAWGVAGLIGALYGRLGPGPLRRLPLALTCAAVGFAFTMVQDLGDWVTYSDHSAAQLGVYVGRGLGFDAVHAAGCLVFALAFGPALARSLRRFTARLEIRWQPPGGLVAPAALIALVLALLPGTAGAPSAAAGGTQSGYLEAAENPDGGLGPAPGQASVQMYSGWAALGLAATGVDPRSVSRGGHSLVSYIEQGAGSSSAGDIERTILALRAAGLPVSAVAGHDLLSELQDQIGSDGSVSDQVNLTAFAILALRSAGAGAPAGTVSWLARQQDSDGGFNYGTAGGASDVDDTGAVLEALAAAGSWPPGVAARAVAFLRGQQNPDGGLPSSPGDDSNAQSTAWAVQGLLAAGIDPGSLRRGGAPTPLQYLQSLIAPDGHIRYSRSSGQTPVWVTGQAMMALAGKPLPLEPVWRRAPGVGAAQPGSSGRARRLAPGRRSGVRSHYVSLDFATAEANRLAVRTAVVLVLVLAPVGAS